MGTIRYCVIPAAGLGTRFLPVTKVLPKEMLPVVDRPVIEWAIEEAMAAGAGEIALVIASGKELIQAHFERQPELEEVLERRGKRAELAAVRHSQELAHITYVLQEKPLGLGHAVLCAADVVGDNPFLCMLPDDLSHAQVPILAQLRQAWDEVQAPVLALMRVAPDQISRYGCATVAESRGRFHRVTDLVEKPKAEEARSDLAIMGRYVLPGATFEALRRITPGAGGELQLTDGIAALLHQGPVWGLEFEGELLDVGTPDGWLDTNVRLARERSLDRAREAVS
ncbi:MAG TPA: UTP--glucose-1-phosphate uridylyltransferase [Candidatus Binatia bacterium]|nr:UTP--glucose-1-phosphate uridylyltransferase [Candidatus Binatia bacterium]